MTGLNSKLMPAALVVLAVGALAGCAFSAAAFATLGGAMFAQMFSSSWTSVVQGASC